MENIIDNTCKVWFNPEWNGYELFSASGEPLRYAEAVEVKTGTDGFPTAKISMLVEVVNTKPVHAKD